MANTKASTKVFNPAAFGEILRSERRKAGFSNTKLLSQAVKQETGVFIDFDTLMKYERGEREPDITKLIAIAFTLYHEKWLHGLNNFLMLSIPIEFENGNITSGIKIFSQAQGNAEEDTLEKQAIKSKITSLEYLLEETLSMLNEQNEAFKKLYSLYEKLNNQDTPPDKGVNDK